MEAKKIPRINHRGQYAATLDQDLAMLNGYIGEVPVRPKALDREMGLIFGRIYFTGTVYYYGIPDEEIKKKFGYN